MIVSYEEAVKRYSQIAKIRRAPSLHPEYVVADAARDPSLKAKFFVYSENPDIYYHAFHLSPVLDTGANDIQSPYGYGGPISTSEDKNFLAKAWQAYCEWCQRTDVLAEFIRFHPLLENWRYYGGEIIKDRQTVWLDLTIPDLMSGYTPRTRTAIRKAEKSGLRVEWWDSSRFLKVFPSLYAEAMKRIGASPFYFFLPEYYAKLIHGEQARLATCLLDDEILGAAVFLVENQVAEYHLSASTETGKRLCATNLILHEGARYCREQGCRFLHLGGGTDREPSNPLLFFKAGFSQKRSCFNIGKYVHNLDRYQEIRNRWQDEHGAVAKRVLFYR